MVGSRLKDKVAIVTGAGSRGAVEGTGSAIATAFAREGARVVVMDLDKDNAQATVARITQEGGRAMVAVGDVSQSRDCENAVFTTIGRFGKLDIVVNNAGITRRATALDFEEADWERIMDVNLKGMALMTKHALHAMVAQGTGVFVNISSVAAVRGYGPTLAYTASKGGVEAMTRLVAVEHGRQGIRANCVAPGNIYAPMVSGSATEEQRNMRSKTNPLGLEGNAWDVAHATLFLASDEARWISGQVLTVDGGYSSAAIAWFEREQRQ